MALFAEVHWYAGGLRHMAVAADGARPRWAPPADWVGLKDDETLGDGEHAVEVRRAAWEGGAPLWVGVYARAVDVKFGDRGNHAGVGIWLDGVVSNGPRLLKGLRTLADAVAERAGRGEEPDGLADDLARFASEFAPGCVAAFPRLPAAFSGLAAGGVLVETARFRACGDAWRDAGERVEALGLFAEGGAGRVLIRIGGGDELPDARPEGLAARAMAALPDAFAESAGAEARAEAEVARLRTELAERDAALRTAEAAAAEARAATAEAEQAAREARIEIARYDRDFTPSLARAFADVQAKLGAIEMRLDRAKPPAVRPAPAHPVAGTKAGGAWFQPAVMVLLLLLLGGVIWLLGRSPERVVMPAAPPAVAPVSPATSGVGRVEPFADEAAGAEASSDMVSEEPAGLP